MNDRKLAAELDAGYWEADQETMVMNNLRTEMEKWISQRLKVSKKPKLTLGDMLQSYYGERLQVAWNEQRTSHRWPY